MAHKMGNPLKMRHGKNGWPTPINRETTAKTPFGARKGAQETTAKNPALAGKHGSLEKIANKPYIYD